MAYRNIEEALITARRIYIDVGLSNLTEIQKITKLDRKTLVKYCELEQWDSQRKHLVVTPQEITIELMAMISEYMKEFKDKRAAKEAIATSSMKEFLSLTTAARRLDERYDVKGTMIVFVRKFLEHIGTLPAGVVSDKELLISMLQQATPTFIAKIESD
jgi:hypothetical protein